MVAQSRNIYQLSESLLVAMGYRTSFILTDLCIVLLNKLEGGEELCSVL